MEKRSDKSCCFLQSVLMGITSVVEWLASADWIVLSYLIRHCIYDFIIVMTPQWELKYSGLERGRRPREQQRCDS